MTIAILVSGWKSLSFAPALVRNEQRLPKYRIRSPDSRTLAVLLYWLKVNASTDAEQAIVSRLQRSFISSLLI
jgi:hypothetical protein